MFVSWPWVAAIAPGFFNHLNSILVKPSWSQYIAHASYINPTLMNILSHASGHDATFHFCGGEEHPVLNYVHKDCNQLALPSGGGFCDIVP